MQEYKVVLTWEAIYDLTDISDYIEAEFGRERADRFQDDIFHEIEKLGYMGGIFGKTQLFYRNYSIHRKLFSPSIIFYILDEKKREMHILRVLREERNWEKLFSENQEYTYPLDDAPQDDYE